MGQQPSRHCLPPAVEVEEAPYDLRCIKAPKLTGWRLQFVLLIMNSPWSAPLWALNMRKNGIPQAMRETDLPEPATFRPNWPLPAGPEHGETVVEGRPVKDRLALAAQAIPGFNKGLNGSLGGKPLQQRWSIADFVQAYTSGALTPAEVAENVLRFVRQSDEQDPPMRFFISCDAADVRTQAAESTARYKQGRPLSVLDGVPYAVIDGIDALPYPTTAGTTFLHERRRVVADAPCIAELKAAGALLVGKANLHEIGFGMTGLNTGHGTTRNPYNVAAYTGGSSSGSAAVVSSGLCAFALGIDGGGSVRVPSALCGIVGLRPTVGRTSTENCPENAFSIMSFGSHTATISDAMLVYAAIANAGRQNAWPGPAPAAVPKQLFDSTPAAAERVQPDRKSVV